MALVRGTGALPTQRDPELDRHKLRVEQTLPPPRQEPEPTPEPSFMPQASYTIDDLFTPGYFEPPRTAGMRGLSLDRLGLSLLPASEWLSGYAPEPEYVPAAYESPGRATPSSGQIARTGGLGPSAYGFSGTTGQAQHKGSAPYGFQAQMWNALQRANSALAAAGLGRFGVTDGFRSYQSQQTLKKRKPTLAATPGRSIHGLGLAADLRLSDAQYRWLLKNGAKYGLVNLPSESWHWQLAPSQWKGP